MGLGRLFNRNIQYQATNTQTGASDTFTLITDGRPGMYPDWQAGEYQGGMGIPGAWRSAILLSDLLGQIPWHAYRERGNRPVEQVPSSLLDQPAPPDVRMTTFSSWGLDLIWHGNAIGLIAARNSDGWPTAALPVSATDVQVTRATDWNDAPFPVGTISYSVGGRWFSSDDVIHVKGPCKPGALRGMGVLENHFYTLQLARDLQAQARSVSDSGIPTGILKITNPDAQESDLRAAKAGWMKSQATRTVAVLNSTTDFQALAWNPSDTQLLESRKFSLHEIALIFGVPLSFLGVEQSSRTYTNQEAEGLNLIKFSLNGHLARFEQTLSQQMPRGTWAKANLDAILRADTLTRYQAHQIAIQNRFVAPSEVRQLEDLAPFTQAQLNEFEAAAPPAPAPEASSLVADETDAESRAKNDDNNLKDYWTKGEGLAKWASSPHPWTALYRHLKKHMPDEQAKRVTSQWFHDVFGIWPGEREGKNPVGKG